MQRVSRLAVFAACFAALALGGCATGLRPESSPESAGFSSERLKVISAAFQSGVDKKEIPGAVVLIARQGKIA
jgi:CubicO group peptidase (beta-lactamase class C family)